MRQAERNAILFGVFAGVVSLMVLLFFLTGPHLLEGAGLVLYLVIPLCVGSIVYLLTRPGKPVD